MKRFARRTLGVCIGLVLGWVAAGIVFDTGSIIEPSAAHAAAKPAGKAGAGKGHDKGMDAAAKLAPESLSQQTTWYPYVLWGVAALFALAIPLGMFAMAMKGEDPPDPAEEHHGHDDHGGGHH